MIDMNQFMNSDDISSLSFPPYLEIHYQSHKTDWIRNNESTSRLCYLAWLLAYEHASPLLNHAKNDSNVLALMLRPYIDSSGTTWTLTNLEIYFVENIKKELLSWGMPPLSLESQPRYRSWFMSAEQFSHYFTEHSPTLRKPPKQGTLETLNNGIDIIGFPFASTGLGELTRSLIAAALDLGININVISLEDSTTISAEYSYIKTFCSTQPKHHIRIFSTTLQNLPVILYTRGVEIFQNSYNILNTAWEFNQRTARLDSAFLLLNEIWPLSSFVKPAFENKFAIPVRVLHCGVNQLPLKQKNRKKWNLPDNTFLFLCAFDFNSYLKRKNPQMAVDAFISAFGNSPEKSLVIKCQNVDVQNEEWKSLLRKIEIHKNIFLIQDNIDRSDFVELLHSVDAFISLHRSEGFGYILAECMKIGVPIICTGYSGNMDFCTSENAYLVDYKLVSVESGDYIQSDGLFWAEPKLDSAIEQMQLLTTNLQLRADKIKNAKYKIDTEFSISSIAKELNSNLMSVNKILNMNIDTLKGSNRD